MSAAAAAVAVDHLSQAGPASKTIVRRAPGAARLRIVSERQPSSPTASTASAAMAPRARDSRLLRALVGAATVAGTLAILAWFVGLATELLGDVLIATVFVLTIALQVVALSGRLLGPNRRRRCRY